MIDLHAHILPGLDDGSGSVEDSLEMAQLALESGVTAIAATPHANLPGSERKDERRLCLEQLEEFREQLSGEGIGLTVRSGMEIFAAGSYLERLKAGELLTLARTRYVLIEFPMNIPALTVYRETDRVLAEGYLPVLAHPERYECIQRVPAHVQEWRLMGAVIQMNKGSILGSFGRSVQRTAESLLRHRLVDIAASDAHSPVRRTTEMSRLAGRLEELGGEACARILLTENPGRMLAGKKVLREPAVPYDYSRR